MEREANFALVGIISVVLLVGALIGIVWLAQFQFNQTYDNYRINFRGPVSGLSRGGEVQFNGIKVGEITHIALDPRDPNKVMTDIQIEHGTPVRVDSAAETASLGITGVKYVQITPGSPQRPLLREASRDRPPVIPARQGRLAAAMENATQLFADGAEAIGRVNRLLSDGNIANISRTFDDVAAVSGELRSRRQMFANIESTFARLDRAAAEMQATAASIRGGIGGRDGVLARINASAAELQRTVAETRTLIGRVNGSVDDVSNSTIPELNASLVAVQRAADSLGALTADIRRDPRGTLGRGSGREVEIPR
jgi:phospholipid/cholesterol/gamma-HCH transport system substrate-binding protein